MRFNTWIKAMGSALLVTPLLGCAGTGSFMNGASLYGSRLAASVPAERVVDASAGRWIYVDYGETVRFKNGDREFDWRFDGLDARSIRLSQIAPASFGPTHTDIDIGRDPRNTN
ncbi:MAG TPA: CzcE family metal-binding protein [Burkholderiaceae bacterium]|jgi:hypothetical protein|nr:CzcE family metal-binding protein [Burkholderiaceae bacterium]